MSVLRAVEPSITPSPAPRPTWRYAPMLRMVAVSFAYLVVFLSLDLVVSRYSRELISPWFLPQGVTLGLLIIGGLVYMPSVFIANLLGNLLFGQMPTPSAIGLALAVTVGYALVSLFARKVLHIDPRLGRLRDAFSLMLVGIVSPLLVGILAAGTLILTKQLQAGEFINTVKLWWNGDLIGLIGITPFILVYGAPWARGLFTRNGAVMAGASLAEREEEEGAHLRVTIKGLLSMVIWGAVIAGVVALTMLPPLVNEFRLFYLCFLVIIWIALQHGMRGTSAGVMAFSLGALAALLYPNTPLPLPELQIFIITLSVTGLLMGAVMSERRHTEGAVRASEDLLRTLINAMPDVVIFKDAAGRWLAANEFCLKLFNLTHVAYQGKTSEELAHEDPLLRFALPEMQHSDALAWEQGAPVRNEESLPQGEDGRLTLDVIKVPLFHPDGRRKGLVVIGRDISERKQAEEELDREHAYLSSAIDILPLPLAFLSPKGEWTQVNAAGSAFVKGLLPKQWLDGQMLTPDTRMLIPRDERPVMRSLQSGQVFNAAEVILILPDGREMPMLIHAGPISVGGKLEAVVAAFQDITAIKEADRAKDEFLGILSHELLTPLADSLGWAQAGKESPDAAPQALDIIEHNVRLLHRVMTDLLDLSRIVHGKLYLAREITDLWKRAEDYAKEFEPLATGRRRTLVLEAPDEEMPVSLDRERFLQVLSTLLDSALKGSDPGDKIFLTGRVEGDTAVLVIRDTGRGLPEETLSHLFTPFYQPHPVEPGRGMGLGMALVKGIIELHGGRITADSPGQGQGTVFTIELPLRLND